MEKRLVNVAVVQAGSILFDTPATLDKMVRLTEEAVALGSKIVVFPEAFLGGYPKGEDFGVTVGRRSDEGRKLFVRYADAAIELPGSELKRLVELSRDSAVFLVCGVIERDRGTLYCTVVFIHPEAGYVGKHRKLMPTAMERVIWGCGDGSTLPVIESGFGKLGAVICWENYMPLLRAAMYQKGIEIYCAPTVDDRDSWSATIRHIACEGRCYVLSACQVQSDPTSPTRSSSSIIRGGSCIVSPFGEIIAGPVFDQEQILTATLDMSEITKGKFDLDVAGHYSRPDLFQLSVNETPLR